MKPLLTKISPLVWFILAAFVSTVGPKQFLEYFNQPVPPSLFLAALMSTLAISSVCISYAISFARGHFDMK
jgi:hypothetical protein